MSKSLNNYIGILEAPEVIWNKLRTAATDPQRIRKKDPGDPDLCNLFTIHKAFSPSELLPQIARQCRGAEIGCIECKKTLYDNMMAELGPSQQRAAELEQRPEDVLAVLQTGAGRCEKIAHEVMGEVRKKVGLR